MLPSSIRNARRRAYEVVALRRSAGDPLVPPPRLHDVGDSDFRATGDEFLELFRDLVDLQPEDRVLDVGCGIGRLARPLAGYLSPEGSYDGFDVAEIAVEWCQRHYRERHPNFHFTYVDVANGSYNPDGSSSAQALAFPYPDASFDFVFLTSVFTHMMPSEVERYLEEIARVLAPGGRCLVTFFLLNESSRELIEQGRSTQSFRDVAPPYAVVDPDHPEAAIAYEEPWAMESLARAGLRPRLPLRYGSWCGRETYLSYQDIVIADKNASGPDGAESAPGPTESSARGAT